MVTIGLTFSAQSACAERRVALVIGNSNYDEVAPVASATRDARAVAKSLTDLGYEVVLSLDGGYADLDHAVNTYFHGLKSKGDVAAAVIYFAGHGITAAGTRYLVPVDVGVRESYGINLSELIRETEKLSNGKAVVLVDACRNEIAPDAPPDRWLDSSRHTEQRGAFTGALLKHIDSSSLPVAKLLKQVASEAREDSKTPQSPFVHVSAQAAFSFAPGRATLGQHEASEYLSADQYSKDLQRREQVGVDAAPSIANEAVGQSKQAVVNSRLVGRWDVQCIEGKPAPLREACSVSQTVVAAKADNQFFIINFRGTGPTDRTIEVFSPVALGARSGVAVIIDGQQEAVIKYASCNKRTCFFQLPVGVKLFDQLAEQDAVVQFEIRTHETSGYRMQIPMQGLAEAVRSMDQELLPTDCGTSGTEPPQVQVSFSAVECINVKLERALEELHVALKNQATDRVLISSSPAEAKVIEARLKPKPAPKCDPDENLIEGKCVAKSAAKSKGATSKPPIETAEIQLRPLTSRSANSETAHLAGVRECIDDHVDVISENQRFRAIRCRNKAGKQ